MGHHAAGFLRAVRLQFFDVPSAWHTGRATVAKKISIFASERSRTAIRSPPRTYNAPQTHRTAAAHCFSTYITDTRGLGVCTVGGSCRTLARTPIRSDHRRRSTASRAVHLHPANAEPFRRARVDFQAAVVGHLQVGDRRCSRAMEAPSTHRVLDARLRNTDTGSEL